ncbi:MAG TPA: hypothetical protein VJT54_00180, partial [Verrucomicrobiae bacterium]|nr:hypothetical protein [Verrucomicrobiae bacterium]
LLNLYPLKSHGESICMAVGLQQALLLLHGEVGWRPDGISNPEPTPKAFGAALQLKPVGSPGRSFGESRLAGSKL